MHDKGPFRGHGHAQAAQPVTTPTTVIINPRTCGIKCTHCHVSASAAIAITDALDPAHLFNELSSQCPIPTRRIILNSSILH
ncbi:hypothetical protein AB3S75_040470 [Citrus x aurantiifolia]